MLGKQCYYLCRNDALLTWITMKFSRFDNLRGDGNYEFQFPSRASELGHLSPGGVDKRGMEWLTAPSPKNSAGLDITRPPMGPPSTRILPCCRSAPFLPTTDFNEPATRVSTTLCEINRDRPFYARPGVREGTRAGKRSVSPFLLRSGFAILFLAPVTHLI